MGPDWVLPSRFWHLLLSSSGWSRAKGPGAGLRTLKASLLNICAIRPACDAAASAGCHNDAGIKNSTAKRCCQSSSHTRTSTSTSPSPSTAPWHIYPRVCLQQVTPLWKCCEMAQMCMGLITKLSGSITATFSTLPGKVATKLMSFSLRLRSDFVKKKIHWSPINLPVNEIWCENYIR